MSNYDTVTYEFALEDNVLDSIVFGVVKKKESKKFRTNAQDIV